MTIYLVRHGQTEFNSQGRFQGWLDSPLTERGQAQARQAGLLLRDLMREEPCWPIVSSPLGRARRTAEIVGSIIGPTSAITLDERLREISLGDWDGLTRGDIDALAGVTGGNALNWWFRAPGGESLEAFSDRLRSWLEETCAKPSPIIVVSHGGAGRFIRGCYLGLDAETTFDLDVPQDALFRLSNGNVDRLEYD